MRRQITLVTVAATAMVVLSFLAPLAFLVRTVVAQHAIDEANAAAQSLVPVAVTDSDPATLARAVAQVDATADGSISVYLDDGTMVGQAPFAARPESLELARSGRAFTQSYDAGVEVFLPILRPESSGPVVVRIVVPDSVLHRNVYSIWFLLGALGIAMVGVAGLVADRIARSIIRPDSSFITTWASPEATGRWRPLRASGERGNHGGDGRGGCVERAGGSSNRFAAGRA